LKCGWLETGLIGIGGAAGRLQNSERPEQGHDAKNSHTRDSVRQFCAELVCFDKRVLTVLPS